MADLPPIAKCESVVPPQGYVAKYQCVSYLARAVGDFDNGPNDRGRFWHAEVNVPKGSDFAEFEFAIPLPADLARRFRIQNIKRGSGTVDGEPGTMYSFTLYGTASYGNCKPGNESCTIPKGFVATLLYK